MSLEENNDKTLMPEDSDNVNSFETAYQKDNETKLSKDKPKPTKRKTKRKTKKRKTTKRFNSSWIGIWLKTRYKVVDKVGEGGMGSVFLARDKETGKTVAVKFLLSKLANDSSYKEKFKKEIAIGEQLNHKNIPKIICSGTSRGVPYIVMDYIAGITLKQFINQHKNQGKFIPINLAVNIVSQIAEALSYAYKKGIIAHRDIKPENIMINSDTHSIKVMDFGIAKITSLNIEESNTSDIFTFAYAAPEQLMPKKLNVDKIDQRVDIYSLGLIFYELLTNRLPFEKSDDMDKIEEKLSQIKKQLKSNEDINFPEFTTKRNIPDTIKNIIRKCLKVQREDRYKNIDELLEDLKNVNVKEDENNLKFSPEKIEEELPQPENPPVEKQYKSKKVHNSADSKTIDKNNDNFTVSPKTHYYDKNNITRFIKNFTVSLKTNYYVKKNITRFIVSFSVLAFVEAWIYYLVFHMLFHINIQNFASTLHLNLKYIAQLDNIRKQHQVIYTLLAFVSTYYFSFFLLPEIILLPTIIPFFRRTKTILFSLPFKYSVFTSGIFSIVISIINRSHIQNEFPIMAIHKTQVVLHSNLSFFYSFYLFILIKYWLIWLVIILPIVAITLNLIRIHPNNLEAVVTPRIGILYKILKDLFKSAVLYYLILFIYPNVTFNGDKIISISRLQYFNNLVKFSFKALFNPLKFAIYIEKLSSPKFLLFIIGLIETSLLFVIVPLVLINIILVAFLGKKYTNLEKMRYSVKISSFIGVIWGTTLGIMKASSTHTNPIQLIVFYVIWTFIISFFIFYVIRILFGFKKTNDKINVNVFK